MKYLTREQRHALALQLDTMRRQVLDELSNSAPGTFAQPALNASQEVRTRADEAEAEREDGVHQAEIEIDRRRLQDIERAQARLSEGRYGICATCGMEIPAARLLAQPIAIRCAACQAQLEAQSR